MSLIDDLSKGFLSLFVVQPWYFRALAGAVVGGLLAVAIPSLWSAGQAQTGDKGLVAQGAAGDVTSNGGIAIGHGNSINGNTFVVNPPPPIQSPTDDDLIRATHTSYTIPPSAYPTAFKEATTAAIKTAVSQIANQMRQRNQSYASKLKVISSDPNLPFSEKRAQLDRALANFTETFQKEELPEARDLFFELLTRLNLPFPRSSREGISIGAYAAIAQGLPRDTNSLDELSKYLETLSQRLT